MINPKAMVCALFVLGVGGAEAQEKTHPLRPISQQDFFRVFGSDPVSGVLDRETSEAAERARSEARSFYKKNQDFPLNILDPLQSTQAAVNSNALLAVLGDESRPLNYFILWHQIALDATAIDHAPTAPGVRQQQVGPARSSRALALVHQSLFEAANVVRGGRYNSTLPNLPTFDVSIEGGLTAEDEREKRDALESAALTEAAYQILHMLYPGLDEEELHESPPNPFVTISSSSTEAECPDNPTFSLRNYYLCSLSLISDVKIRDRGQQIGRIIAAEIEKHRENDGSQLQEPEIGDNFNWRHRPGKMNRAFVQWTLDPVSKINTAIGGNWSKVKTFSLTSQNEFRPSESEAPRVNMDNISDNEEVLREARKLKSYAAVVKWGGDPRLNGTGASDTTLLDRFFIAQLWAYDGTAYLCAPPRLYNQIAAKILQRVAEIKKSGGGAPDVGLIANKADIDPNDSLDVARFFALVNFAMADAAIAAWDAKYYFQFPRPVTYIRAVQALDKDNQPLRDMPAPQGGSGRSISSSEASSVVSGNGSEALVSLQSGVDSISKGKEAKDTLARGNSAKPKWFPAGAQVTNSDAPYNITPPFPAYVSGHAAFGGAVFGVLRQFIDAKAEFNYISDEFNGRNKDVFNYVRCDGVESFTDPKFCEPRVFTIDCAERENADSRLWMGVHWIDDADDGIALGNRVARAVYTRMMRPRGMEVKQSTYSVEASGYPSGNPALREALVCKDVTLPNGWSDPNGEIGFGTLEIISVAPQQ